MEFSRYQNANARKELSPEILLVHIELRIETLMDEIKDVASEKQEIEVSDTFLKFKKPRYWTKLKLLQLNFLQQL